MAQGATSRMGPSIFVLFHPFYICFFHPTSFESFILFLGWTGTSLSRFGIHCSAWGRHGRKATLHVYLEGERCRGQRSVDMRLVEGLLCPNVWEVARLGTWRMTAPLQLPPPPLLRCGLICCCTLVGKCKWRREKKNQHQEMIFFLYYYSCMDHFMQEPP